MISESEEFREAYQRERIVSKRRGVFGNRNIGEFTEPAYCEQTFLVQSHFSSPSSLLRVHTRTLFLSPFLFLFILPFLFFFLDASHSDLPSFPVLASFVLVGVFVREPFICLPFVNFDSLDSSRDNTIETTMHGVNQWSNNCYCLQDALQSYSICLSALWMRRHCRLEISLCFIHNIFLDFL